MTGGRRDRQTVRRPFGLLTALLAVACWSLSFATPVLAHAEVIDTSPGDGTVVTALPAAFSITFNEAVGVESDSVKIYNAAGRQVDSAAESVAGTTLTQPLDPLPSGWYLATWRVISSDGHVVESAASFGVGSADEASRKAVLALRSSEAPLFWTVRFAADLSLLVAVGALYACVALRAKGRNVRRFAIGAVTLAAFASLLWVAMQVLLGGAAWLTTGNALGGIARTLLLSGASVASMRTPRVAIGLAVVAVATLAVGGHPGAAATSSALLVVHLVSAALWIGAAPALVVAYSDRTVDDPSMLETILRFSRSSAVAIAFVFGGGIMLGWLLTDGLAGGLSAYVLLLCAKLLLAVAALLGGALMRRRLRAGTASRTLAARLFALDTVTVLAIAALSAGLTLGSPHAGHAGHSGHCVATIEGATVSITLSPGTIGANRVLISGVAQAERVRLETSLRSKSERLVAELEASSGAWQGGTVFPVAGTWEATLVVGKDQFTEVRGSCTLDIAP